MGEQIGKFLLIVGLVMAAAGVVLIFSDKIPWIGRLPGDLHIKKDNFSIYFPLTTSILISLLLSALFWLFRK